MPISDSVSFTVERATHFYPIDYVISAIIGLAIFIGIYYAAKRWKEWKLKLLYRLG